MNKYLLLFLILLGVIISTILLTKSQSAQKEHAGAGISKPKYLCDNAVADCGNNTAPGVPKGVCLPGGKCT